MNDKWIFVVVNQGVPPWRLIGALADPATPASMQMHNHGDRGFLMKQDDFVAWKASDPTLPNEITKDRITIHDSNCGAEATKLMAEFDYFLKQPRAR